MRRHRRPHGERNVRHHDHGRLLRGAARYQALRRGHSTTLVCLPEEAELINREGQRVRLPVRGRDGLVEVDSRKLPGRLSGTTTDAVDPAAFRPGRPRHAGAPVRRTGGARAPGCGGPIRRPLHVHHEHAAAPLPGPDSGARPRAASRLLHRPFRVGLVRPGEHDPVQPGRAGVPPPRREHQRSPGQPADELSVGPIRIGRAHRHPAHPAGRHRGHSIR